jgi:hypothetical protein
MSLVANGAQDVYLVQSNTTKLKYDVNKLYSRLQSEETKLPSSGGLGQLVANGAQDVYQIQSDVNKLQTAEHKLQSDLNKLQTAENATSAGH